MDQEPPVEQDTIHRPAWLTLTLAGGLVSGLVAVVVPGDDRQDIALMVTGAVLGVAWVAVPPARSRAVPQVRPVWRVGLGVAAAGVIAIAVATLLEPVAEQGTLAGAICLLALARWAYGVVAGPAPVAVEPPLATEPPDAPPDP